MLRTLKEIETKTFEANFPPAFNFRDARETIDSKSIVFPFIKSMPKGK